MLQMLRDIAVILQPLHEMGVVHRKYSTLVTTLHASTRLTSLFSNRIYQEHRNLSLESIYIKRSQPEIQLILGGFDLAVKLERGQKAIQQFGLDLAPEIESGEPHDTSADIWALGRMAKQLLEYESIVREAELVTQEQLVFISKMVSRNPSKRPSITDVIAFLNDQL